MIFNFDVVNVLIIIYIDNVTIIIQNIFDSVKTNECHITDLITLAIKKEVIIIHRKAIHIAIKNAYIGRFVKYNVDSFIISPDNPPLFIDLNIFAGVCAPSCGAINDFTNLCSSTEYSYEEGGDLGTLKLGIF